jgi:serine O-acetyltransferase
MNFIFNDDYYRMTGKKLKLTEIDFYKEFLFHHNLKFVFYMRCITENKFKLLKPFFKVRLFCLGRRYGLEINANTKIGNGFRLVHPYNITISPYAVIGRNVNIFKGATIGTSDTSWEKRRGSPIIGDKVQIGINSTIIGKIRVGNNVVIAPNSFVNKDIPDNSIVIGNPCRIMHKEDATTEFVYFLV